MEHVCSSRKDEEENPLYLDFPSPFFDDISTILASPNKALSITEPEPEPSDQSKRVKKRSVGKKDRHSKIHTAQGPRDRRMRLSLQIARKFFDLQDLLGFDKASDTIEWLFCKSNKDIIEVAKNFDLQQTNHKQNTSEEIETMDNSKDEEIKNRDSGKQILNNYSVKETRDQARARARGRTRERMMIRELEKSKQVSGGNNPKDEIYKLGLGYLGNPNILNIEELGYTSCPPATIQQESRTHHLDESTYCSTMVNHNPPAGWLDSCNEFLRMSGDCDTDSLLTDYYNYGIVPSTSQLTSDIYEQNPSSFFMSTTNNILQFQSRNQGK